jgi:hypothetical protein
MVLQEVTYNNSSQSDALTRAAGFRRYLPLNWLAVTERSLAHSSLDKRLRP